ncbi:MAG: hypothetical protein KGI97_01475 [Alphaproteobacteria bacterium]|nr:hypothetical protein [Alphaproteobacteria bacterium]
MSEKPFIVVGTPCFGGMVSQNYTMSLLNLSEAAAREGFRMAVVMLGNDALITRGRSAIVAKFLDNPETTHLLFVDADIGFSVEAVTRMLKFGQDFVAGLYPAKIIDWHQLAQHFGRTPEALDEAGLAYVGALCEGAEARRKDGFATGTYAGTGFQLIKRDVFKRMIDAYPQSKYRSLHAFPRPSAPSDNLYALFDCMIDAESGVYLSEDYAFCRRWRAIGGEIWLDLESKLTHNGSYTYRGNAAARFMEGMQ